jgi:putative tricarboxylic transport membrane protein
LLLLISAVFAYGLTELNIGTAYRMGPGYFPMVLTGMLTIFALVMVVNGFRTDGEPIGAIPWRGLIIVTLSVVLYGATLRGLGMVPALALTVFLSTFASERWDAKLAVGITILLVASCYVIFLRGLGLPLSPFGPWVGGY